MRSILVLSLAVVLAGCATTAGQWSTALETWGPVIIETVADYQAANAAREEQEAVREQVRQDLRRRAGADLLRAAQAMAWARVELQAQGDTATLEAVYAAVCERYAAQYNEPLTVLVERLFAYVQGPATGPDLPSDMELIGGVLLGRVEMDEELRTQVLRLLGQQRAVINGMKQGGPDHVSVR